MRINAYNAYTQKNAALGVPELEDNDKIFLSSFNYWEIYFIEKLIGWDHVHNYRVYNPLKN